MKSVPTLCGSISGSIGGLGVRMHNAAYKHLDLAYTYVSFQPTNLEKAIDSMRVLGIRGLGVTMPFKKKVMPLLDDLDDAVKKIGAVNTIVNDEGHLEGYNTDWYGIEKALLEVIDLTDKKVIVIGAGGAARAALYALKRHTKHISLYNRHEGRGRSLAEDFGLVYKGQLSDLGDGNREDYDIVINTTSVGFKTLKSPLDIGQLLPRKVVMDIVFMPVETTLLKYAKELECTIVEGYKVSLYQAAYQFQLYTGKEAPVEVMKEALWASL